MNNEFKKIDSNKETRYVLETTSGASSSASVASNPSAGFKNGFGVQSRKPGDNLLTQESDKKKVPAEKPRNFVAKNAKMGGAGAHKKKEADIPRKAKHKKPFMESYDDTEQEVSMAGSELFGAAKHAKQLLVLIQQHGGVQGLEAWQQSKITKAADYLNAVLQSLDYDTNGDEQGVAEGAVKELVYDIKNMSDQDFQAKYHMSKAEARKQSSSASGLKEMMGMLPSEGMGNQEGSYEFTTVILNPNFNIDDENSPEEIDIKVTYDVEGEHHPATWGYHGGEPEENPELNIMTVTDLENGQEILDTLEVPVVNSLEEKAWEHYEQQEPDFDDSPDDDYYEGRSVMENADVNREIAVLEKQLSNAEAGLRRAREITRQIKYDSVSMTIISEITELAKSLGLEANIKYNVSGVMEAERALEAAIYELEEAFEEQVSNIRYKVEEFEDQLKYPQESIDPYLNGLTVRLESAVSKGK
jgi:uncharacterized protein YfcZ (UPF0381/DUF406 family)